MAPGVPLASRQCHRDCWQWDLENEQAFQGTNGVTPTWPLPRGVCLAVEAGQSSCPAPYLVQVLGDPATSPPQCPPSAWCRGPSVWGAVRGPWSFPCGGRGPDRHVWTGRARQRTELVLKDLQKHFHGAWFVLMQDLTMVMLAVARAGARAGSVCRGERAWPRDAPTFRPAPLSALGSIRI